MGVGTIVEAIGDDLEVGLKDLRLLGELGGEELLGLLQRTVEEPEYKTECENITAASHRLGIHTCIGKTCLSGFGNGNAYQLVLVGNAHLSEWIERCKLGLGKFRLDESVLIINQYSTLLEELDILLQGSRIHGNEHVALVTRSINFLSDMYLERRYATQRTARCTHFSRIIRESGNLIS